jgi:hypothetical protein
MHAITGDETGLIKLVALKRKAVVARCGVQSRTNRLSQLSWLPGSNTHVAALSKGGVLQVWDTLTGERVDRACIGAGDDAALLAVLPSAFMTCSRAGVVRLFPQAAEDATKEASREVRIYRVRAARLLLGTPTPPPSCSCAVFCREAR